MSQIGYDLPSYACAYLLHTYIRVCVYTVCVCIHAYAHTYVYTYMRVYTYISNFDRPKPVNVLEKTVCPNSGMICRASQTVVHCEV